MARYNYGQNHRRRLLSLYQKSIGQRDHRQPQSDFANPANSTLGALSGLVGGVGLLDKLGGSKNTRESVGGGAHAGTIKKRPRRGRRDDRCGCADADSRSCRSRSHEAGW